MGAKLPDFIDSSEDRFLLERRVSLPESQLWTLQRAFYAGHGHEIWADASVPHYITSNPVIADAQAQVIIGFLRDLRAKGTLQHGELVNVIELGSGTGRFGFLVIQRLRWLISHSSLADVAVRLIMTDFTDQAAAKLSRHRQLGPLARDGWVDFAQFDAATPGPLRLLHSGELLCADTSPGPLVIVANYVLDSLPQECVALRSGKAQRGLLTVESGEPFDVTAPASAPADLNLSWDYVPFEDSNRSAIGPEWSAVVADYAEILDDTTMLLPTAALDCVSHFRGPGSGTRLFLFTDKGIARTSELMGRGDPGVAWHGGCFSMMVNFDGLGRCILARGGLVLHPWQQPAHIVCTAYVLGNAGPWPETELAYADNLAERGPDDFFTLKAAALADPGSLTFSQMLTYLRVSRFDPVVFQACFSPLLDVVAAAPADARPDVARVLEAVWAQYFAIGEESDLALCLGLILAAMHYYHEAQQYFHVSITEHGATADAALGLALCANGLGDHDGALDRVEESLALNPSLSSAVSLRRSLTAQLAQTMVGRPSSRARQSGRVRSPWR